MDIAELIELEKRKEIAAAEEKLRAKMNRQIRIFNKEKSIYTRKTLYEVSKQRRALNVLEIERDRELDNYLATRSEAVEKKYRSDEDVVRKLVKTTEEVKQLLQAETDTMETLNKEVDTLDNKKWGFKKELSNRNILNAKMRFPDPTKMARRIEWAEGKYHTQLNKNRAMQSEIDNAIFLRDKFMKEESRLLQKLDSLNRSVTMLMHETSDIYEQRDRAEGTKLKVKEHLCKVKDQYERELLNISLAINDDKKMEQFMRTKHKDIIQYLQQKRDKDLADATETLNRKDSFSEAFDVITEAIGKYDLNQIVQDFIEAEEDNFITFLNIGEILDDNEDVRSQIRNLRRENVTMEERDIGTLQNTQAQIYDIRASVDSYRTRSQACQKRLEEQGKMIEEFTGHIQNIIGIMKIDKIALDLGKDGQIKDNNLLGVMTAIERELSEEMRDFCMLELSTRAVIRSKPKASEDDRMITRIPSFHIGPHITPKLTPVNLAKEKEDVEEVKIAGLLSHNEVIGIAAQSLWSNQAANIKKTQSKKISVASKMKLLKKP
ncbi:hypothetical protein BsWGS_07382 [Bradybaena similaris]